MKRTMKTVLGMVTVIALFCCVLFGCGSRGGDSFGFTLTAEPKQIDPQVASDAASLAVIEATFEGLARLDENGNITEGAASWTVSADKKTYTFKLKESYWSTVKVRGTETGFEDPVMVTAYDFEFGMRRTADPTTASPYASLMRGVEVKAVDDLTLRITLSAPDERFLEKLVTPGFMPCNQAFFEYTGGRYGLEKQYILTNGAFYVSAWEHGTSVSLKKNGYYHQASEVLPSAVKYRVTKSADEDFELLRSGNLDAALVPESCLDAAEKADIRLVEMRDTVQYLWMNQSVPALQNVHIRKALAAAIEWDALRENLPPGYTFSHSFTAPAALHALQADAIRAYTTDAAKATALLKQGMAQLQTEKAPTLTLLAADDENSANLARYILQSFSKNLSIQCTLQLVDAQTLAARVQAGNYELAVYAVTGKGLTAKENLEIFTSTVSSGNFARFADPTFDALYASVGEDTAAITRLSDYLYERCPVLPLGYYTRYYGVRNGCEGVTVYPFNGGARGATVSFRYAEITK